MHRGSSLRRLDCPASEVRSSASVWSGETAQSRQPAPQAAPRRRSAFGDGVLSSSHPHCPLGLTKTDRRGARALAAPAQDQGVAILEERALLAARQLERRLSAISELHQRAARL